MFRPHRVHRDLFWAGFLTGMIAGGTLGVLLGSEVGRKTRKRMETAAREVRSRLNGASPPEEAQVSTVQQTSDEEQNIQDAT
ncbi:MAG: YtxH domain-containing protein [bacterium]|nr:YtxH domain-containing protein [bacterium]